MTGTDQVRAAYSAVAPLYIDLFGAEDRVAADDLALIGRHLAGVRGPVLDLGCGPGHLTAYLRSLGAAAIGVDLVPEFVAHARATHPDGDYRLGSLTDPDLPAAGGVLAWYSLIHLPPPELDAALAGFARLLSPGGRLVIGFFTAGSGEPAVNGEPAGNAGTADSGGTVEAFDHKVTTAYRWPPAELSARLAAAGFTETERLLRPVDPAHRPHGAIAAVHRGRGTPDHHASLPLRP
ncbi:methyltransferase [Actinoplanes philippinensis]|uniref:Methyltransferase domain-containing protein n=1 Tax=Actinoplanes philippinensis TaxID=35752 RepID=A0A1I2GCY9_9ACTN|nr:class I SAM-dependent methyltransferase [Actinoplanes philippinensis]GIE76782.1 methyltransferase [Actinoplanes philippinensis]SFF14616.1 Methyltransferase domain-containing protein [Actinoplanes philippinensis]